MNNIIRAYFRRIELIYMFMLERCRRIKIASQGIMIYAPIGGKAFLWFLLDIFIMLILLLAPIILFSIGVFVILTCIPIVITAIS